MRHTGDEGLGARRVPPAALLLQGDKVRRIINKNCTPFFVRPKWDRT
jgi:hypothetical protein